MNAVLPRLNTLPEHLDLRDWDRFGPELEGLADQPIDLATAADWLRRWSDLAIRIAEAAALISIEHSRDTQDPQRKADYLFLITELLPRLRPIEQRLKQRLLASGYSEPGLEPSLRQFASDAELFRLENVPLLAEEQATASRYDEIVGGMTVDFAGGSRTLSQLQPYLSLPDRSQRQAAWEARQSAYDAESEALDTLYESLLPLRERIAEQAGRPSYIDYRWRQLGRFDYSPADAQRFHASIRASFTPALARRAARKAARLGLPALRPWDSEVDPRGGRALQPFRTGEELAETGARVLGQVGPVLGERLSTLQAEGLLDLDNRKNKAPGGYCSTLHARGLPFIFMNAVGTDDNMRTMLHEAGHAFHAYEAGQLPLIWQRGAPMEFCEVASMSMELLASPYIGRDTGGFYDPDEAIRSRLQHLERMIDFMPYMATVSAFQHWVHEHPGHSRSERHAAWFGLHADLCVGADWTGLESARMRLWHQKLHIFRAPFYYIEYGIAQLGALQVWRASKIDPEATLARYLDALALGGTRSLTELFRAAGAELIWDAEPMAELVALVEAEIDALESSLTPA
ncbi:MAG: M3 family oligoendopeptidase [Chloroflexi bacterium]|nr:M3 family oligoendopeptidase [Chloroflexota bacterium]